ncbi:hypothetical protein MTR67_046515 [Solanum verrucosum]|uniref:Uncharacterized protein n=1 Tax=Solanum verrucosum TaxID=315347 RepID=A0AAF0UW25_SOLVR|nr:hypothetical protein MTR67_046515 [Solanum verrucosum]
MQLFVFCDI